MIKVGANKYSDLIIHPKKAEEIHLGRKKCAFISFGSQKHYVNISISNEISPENILLSQELIEELNIPDYPIYELYVNKNEIIIGPNIGLLFSEQDKRLTTSRLKKLMIYLRDYSKLHGAIIVFALDHVDMKSQRIEGHCYNPIKNSWQRGVFPYPSSIYRSIGLDEKWKNHFLSVIGDNVFNSHYFSKWEMYQWFSKDSEINPSIPYTVLYKSPQNVLDLLEMFRTIYIKPVLGLRGQGIVQVSKENNTIVFKYREGGVNGKNSFENLSEVNEYIEKRFHHGKYLIQQGLDLMEYQGRIIDFRCVMQKNQSNRWVCNTIFGRQGDQGSIVSNISNGGVAFTAVDILEKVFPSSKENILDWKEKIESFAIGACNVLNEYGINCGNLGLDIGIDKQRRIWLIEINSRDPDPRIALDIHDKQLYWFLKTSPLFYAKSLAGFTGNE